MTSTFALLTIDLFRHSSSEPGREAAFLVLLAFVLSFGFIRTSARLTRSVSWWPGGVETDSGLHIHHLVWGIVLLLVTGFAAFATDLSAPWWQVTAIGFGIGAGLTLDEFALWVRLQDVYWADEGRVSVDAVVLAVVFAGLVVVGVQPYGLDETSSIVGTALIVTATLGVAIVCFLKGRIVLGILALFFPLIAGVWGVIRLAKPASPWAKRYDEAKLARARERYDPKRRTAEIRQELLDAIGGKPSEDGPKPPPQPKRRPAESDSQR